MKPTFHVAALFAVSLLCQTDIRAQANTTLSNLVAPVAVNRDLTPGATNTYTLGIGAFSWKNIYIGSYYYLKNIRVIHNSGTNNFFVGPSAGTTAVTGTNNTALGSTALGAITTGGYNTAVGYTALSKTTTGVGNQASGYNSTFNNTTGSYNTASGHTSLYTNATGNYNTSVGYGALYSNTTSYNSAFGAYALYANSTGANNTATGYAALYLNTTGSRNSAFGHYALEVSTTGSDNTATGYYALQRNTTGINNTAVGSQSLYNATTAGYNTATGAQALYSTTLGNYNTANGYYSLRANTTGSSSTGIGYYALYSNNIGIGNTAVGSYSLDGNTGGDYNTGVGRFSLSNNTTGNYNTAVGYSADVNAGTFTNATALGYNASATASNQVRIGNSTVTSIGGYASWSNISDGRFKKNIKDNVAGLAFINKLKTITYNLDITGINSRMSGRKTADSEVEASSRAAVTEREREIFSGFVAQDVEKAAKEIGYAFSGIDAPKNEGDLYSLRYADFVVPLVKAVQELSGQNSQLQQQNDSLQQQTLLLAERLQKVEAFLKMTPSTNLSLSASSLAQNSPNPFRGRTVIPYNVPLNAGSAYIVLYDAAGKILKQLNISGKGRGTVNLDAATLASGTYHYSLFVEGNIVDSKKMILMK